MGESKKRLNTGNAERRKGTEKGKGSRKGKEKGNKKEQREGTEKAKRGERREETHKRVRRENVTAREPDSQGIATRKQIKRERR